MHGRSLVEDRESQARTLAAWGVHLLTASGAAAGLMAVIHVSQHRWISAFAWMAITIAIDSVDGTLARLVKVKSVLPNFNGELLDNIVDYFTYVVVPAFFLYESGMAPARLGLLAAMAMTLASGYQFCQADAKTDDFYFKGFPSYWNVVVFYLFLLPFPQWVNLAIVALLVAAVFVPLKYLYPSRTPTLRPLTVMLTLAWAALLLIALASYPDQHLLYVHLSLFYLLYYFAMSAWLTLKPIFSF